MEAGRRTKLPAGATGQSQPRTAAYGAMAFWRRMIGERAKAAMKAAKARGVRIGGLRDKGVELQREAFGQLPGTLGGSGAPA